MINTKKLAHGIADEIVQLRRSLHQIPEMAFCEEQTAALICAYLDDLGVPYQCGIAQTGIVATITGDLPGDTILFRADMDALPISEQTGLPYASKHRA